MEKNMKSGQNGNAVNGDFQFRNFVIRQNRCGMKVGTDGVLLGAWAPGGHHILDIGTGTGLIALMMAQRFEKATIDGIDIDGEACQQASENVNASPFAKRVRIICCSLQDYHAECRYDAIVSNPPYFLETLQSPDPQRAQSRHATSLPFNVLFECVNRLLTEDGSFSVIVPTNVVESLMLEASLNRFYPIRKCFIKTVERKTPKRILMTFCRLHPGIETTETTELLQDSTGKRSAWYTDLTQDFYIR